MVQLHQLQNQIKRDPSAYADEFSQQLKTFEAEREIFLLRPVRDPVRFLELTQFVAQVANLYPDESTNVGPSLVRLLEEQCDTLSPHVRKTLFQALILMRNRGMVPVPILFSLGFKLFQCQDKALRDIIMKYIIADIKSLNRVKSSTNVKINSEIQSIIYKVVQNNNQDICSKKGLEILIELYRRRLWNDPKTVNVIASGCLSQTTKMMIMSIHFFLGIESKMEDDEEEAKESLVEVDFHAHSKKTNSRLRDTRKLIKKRAKQMKDEQNGDEKAKDIVPLYPAIEMLNDPQDFGEKLFKKLKACKESFDIRLLIMNLLSRLIGYHKLLILGFYSFTQRYLNSHQQHVTHILAYLVQATHEIIPPDEFVPILKTVADNFVTERRPAEVIAVGLNGIREIIVRIPSVLDETGMADLVQDLILYAKARDRTAMMAGRTLLNTIREIYPSLLRGKDRGRGSDKTIKPLQYGEEKVFEGVDGAELLMEEELRLEKLNADIEKKINAEKNKRKDMKESDIEKQNGEREDDVHDDNTEKEESDEDSLEDGINEEDDESDALSEDEEEAMDMQEDNNEIDENDVDNDHEESNDENKNEEDTDIPQLVDIENVEHMETEFSTSPVESSKKRKRQLTDTEEIDANQWETVESEEDEDEFGWNNQEAIQEYKTILHKRRKLIASEVDATVVFPELRRMSNKQKREYKKSIVFEKLEEAMKSEKLQLEEKYGIPSLNIFNDKDEESQERKISAVNQKERIDANRILSKEDFEKIRKLKARKEEEKRNPSALRRRLREESEQALAKLMEAKVQNSIEKDDTDKGSFSSDDESINERSLKPGFMDPSTLQGNVSKKRASKEERLLRAISGKNEFEHTKHAGGLTNKEKARKKNYLMVRKGKQSIRDKHRQTQKDVMRRRNRDNKAIKLKHERRKRRRT